MLLERGSHVATALQRVGLLVAKGKAKQAWIRDETPGACRSRAAYHKYLWTGYCRWMWTNITGYKKKKLRHPSEILSSEMSRALAGVRSCSR